MFPFRPIELYIQLYIMFVLTAMMVTGTTIFVLKSRLFRKVDKYDLFNLTMFMGIAITTMAYYIYYHTLGGKYYDVRELSKNLLILDLISNSPYIFFSMIITMFIIRVNGVRSKVRAQRKFYQETSRDNTKVISMLAKKKCPKWLKVVLTLIAFIPSLLIYVVMIKLYFKDTANFYNEDTSDLIFTFQAYIEGVQTAIMIILVCLLRRSVNQMLPYDDLTLEY